MTMTSNHPYLVRALYEWISDNDMTPHLVADATVDGVRVPSSAVSEGQVVLNIASQAVRDLHMGNAEIGFLARFGGASHAVQIPIAAVRAIYARETGEGMVFGAAEQAPPTDPADPAQLPHPAPNDPPPDEPPPRPGPHLRVVK